MNVPASGHESAAARRLRCAALVAIALLFALLVRWVVGAPFLYVGHRRSFAWLTLALAPSLVLGLMEAVVDPATRAWSMLFVFVLLATFVLFVAYLRATRSS